MMPMQRDRYPDDWEEISRRIRFERAGNKCEQCGAPNGVEIVRSSEDPARWIWLDETDYIYKRPDGSWIRLSEMPDEYDILKYTRVVLTVHHIGVEKPDGTPGDMHDKMDCRDENLIALCQRCHLLADLPEHIRKARITRARKKREAQTDAGQLEMWDGE